MAYPAPSLPPTGYPTPPDSPRKQRRVLRESEDTDGEMPIERYIDHSDPFRSTSLRTPLPYPLRFTDSSSLQKAIYPLLDKIQQVLANHGFPDSASIAPQVATKPRYPGGNSPVNILRIIYRAGDLLPRGYGPAKDALCQLLRDHGIHDMEVEVVEIDHCFRPSLFAIQPDHPLVLAYEQAKNNLVNLLQARLRSHWAVLCPFNVGRVEDKAVPTIVVFVDPMTWNDWSDLTLHIKRGIGKFSAGSLPEVEFMPGDLAFPTTPVSFEDRITPDRVPEMGYSIGIRDVGNAGTMGGFVTLTQNGVTHRGVLTNYHVVRPSDPNFGGPGHFLKQLDQFGSSSGALETADIVMEALAKPDADATSRDIYDRIQGLRDQIDRYRKRIAQNAMIGGAPQTWMVNAIPENERQIRELYNRHAIAQEMPYQWNVLHTSGKTVLGRRICDWAFVDIPANSASWLFHANRMPHVPSNQAPWRYRAGIGNPAPEGVELTEFGRLEKGQCFLKNGRTSRVTAGICNGARAVCNWTGKGRTRYDHNGKEVVLEQGTTEEYVIVSKTVDQPEREQAPFAKLGDSGSFVLDVEGHVCGLLYGSLDGLCGPPDTAGNYYVGAGLVMDLPDLSESIRLKTVRRGTNGEITGQPASLGLP
ncbi:hypothetical protein PHISP_07724 [Aspergillus sp. HF37]|nr:hypothetical protein PHISP_07724 [Aspergillus sp. HF37]